MKLYLLWNVERGQWWKGGEVGYTPEIEKAGLYSESRSREIIDRSRIQEYDYVDVRIPLTSVGVYGNFRYPAIVASTVADLLTGAGGEAP